MSRVVGTKMLIYVKVIKRASQIWFGIKPILDLYFRQGKMDVQYYSIQKLVK